MGESLDWLPDGAPFSPRFGDRYHGIAGHGLPQARVAFLAGCGLPAAWAGQPRWRILETGFGLGLNFLVTWAAWRADPQRPRILHFVSCEGWPVRAEDLLRAAPDDPQLRPLARQLAEQFWGLLPGVHRLSFEGGRVLLTLLVGDAQAMLRQQQPSADSVYLDGFSPERNPEMWSVHTLRAVARCCRRGTRLATWSVARSVRETLAQCGFVVHKVPGVHPKRENLQAVFDPPWQPRPGRPPLPPAGLAEGSAPGHCLVVGAGLAGAAVAASLARRGWRVRVLDAGHAPAAGASGLPAGVFAPHVSPDDSLLSRLSRAGVRLALQTLGALAAEDEGMAWQACGVLEHGVDAPMRLAWDEGPGLEWSRPATAAQRSASHLPPGASACWHVRGGWVRPPALIARLLAQPGVSWQGRSQVARLQPAEGRWHAFDAAGQALATAELVVVCAGPASAALTGAPWTLQPLRGQIAWGLHAALGSCAASAPWPGQPLNGHGNLVPRVPLPEGAAWVLGATFERGRTELPPTPAEARQGLDANLGRLCALAPALGAALVPCLRRSGGAAGAVRTWAAVRCAAPDRLPLVGPVEPRAQPGLWVSTAMGARGLTLALLCGELLAARLHDEPLPVEARLARALMAERLALP